MSVIVELSIIPLGVGVSVSEYLAPALKVLEKLNVKYETTPMCTIFEAENIKEAFDVIIKTHEATFKKQVKRVITTVKIDDRRDISRNMNEKLESLCRTLKN